MKVFLKKQLLNTQAYNVQLPLLACSVLIMSTLNKGQSISLSSNLSSFIAESDSLLLIKSLCNTSNIRSLNAV